MSKEAILTPLHCTAKLEIRHLQKSLCLFTLAYISVWTVHACCSKPWENFSKQIKCVTVVLHYLNENVDMTTFCLLEVLLLYVM
jgi:hypothetical protein